MRDQGRAQRTRASPSRPPPKEDEADSSLAGRSRLPSAFAYNSTGNVDIARSTSAQLVPGRTPSEAVVVACAASRTAHLALVPVPSSATVILPLLLYTPTQSSPTRTNRADSPLFFPFVSLRSSSSPSANPVAVGLLAKECRLGLGALSSHSCGVRRCGEVAMRGGIEGKGGLELSAWEETSGGGGGGRPGGLDRCCSCWASSSSSSSSCWRVRGEDRRRPSRELLLRLPIRSWAQRVPLPPVSPGLQF